LKIFAASGCDASAGWAVEFIFWYGLAAVFTSHIRESIEIAA